MKHPVGGSQVSGSVLDAGEDAEMKAVARDSGSGTGSGRGPVTSLCSREGPREHG